MDPHDPVEANRRMWNETAKIHAQATFAQWLERVAAPDFSTFDEVEKRIFAGIDLKGKAVIQLGCNNGRELIAVKKAGAGRCVGVDVSDAFVAQARQLADRATVDVEFVRASVYELPAAYHEQFDVVYVTIGLLGWLPDLDACCALVARLLRTGGQLFIYDMHPILNMFEAATGLEVDASYFRTEPFVDTASPDYLDPAQVVQAV